MTSIRRHQLILFCLFSLILFHGISNFFWIKSDYYIPRHDENQYLSKSVNTLRLLKEPSRMTLVDFLEVEPKNRPHLFPMSAWPFFFFGGISYDSACLANSFFLIIVILATFGIGRSFGNPERGLLAAFIVSFYPFVLKFSRFFWSEIALMACCATALYFLIKTKNFKSTGYSIGLGIVITAGLLTQQRFFFFILTPILLTIFFLVFPPRKSCPELKKYRGRRLVNLLLCLLIPTILAVPYYLYYFQVFFTKFSYGITGGAWEPVKGTFTPQALFWYLGQIQKTTSLFFFIIFVTGFISLLIGRNRKFLLLLLTFVGCYLILTFYPAKDARYISPLLPIAAVITAESIWLLRTKILKAISILLIIIFSILNYLRVSWDVDPFNISYRESLLKLPFFSEPLELIPHAKAPRAFPDWKWEKIITRVSEELDGEEAKLLIAPYLPDFNFLTFSYFCLLSGEKIESVGVGTKNLYYYNFKNLIEADYIVTKTGKSVPREHIRFEFARKTVDLLKNPPITFQKSHKEIAQYPLHDGSEAILISRTSPLTIREEMAMLEEVLKIDPEHPWARRRLGEIYLKEGMPRKALNTFRGIITVLPDWPGGYLGTGRALLDLGRTEEAIEMIQRGLASAPDFDFAHYILGTAYEQAGRIEDARKEYIEAMKGCEERAIKARERLLRLQD